MWASLGTAQRERKHGLLDFAPASWINTLGIRSFLPRHFWGPHTLEIIFNAINVTALGESPTNCQWPESLVRFILLKNCLLGHIHVYLSDCLWSPNWDVDVNQVLEEQRSWGGWYLETWNKTFWGRGWPQWINTLLPAHHPPPSSPSSKFRPVSHRTLGYKSAKYNTDLKH